MAIQSKHICGALRDKPDLAREIGLLIADYAALEFLFFQIFVMLTRLRPQEAFSAFFSLRSINRKTKLVEDELWRLSPQLQAASKRVIRRLKGAASRRTEIAHAHIMQGAGAPMRLHLYGATAEMRPLNDDFINRTMDQFHTLATDILRLASCIGALAPDILLPRLDQLYAPLDAQLQRSRLPQDQKPQLGADEKLASDKRLGIDPNQRHSIQLSTERDMSRFGW